MTVRDALLAASERGEDADLDEACEGIVLLGHSGECDTILDAVVISPPVPGGPVYVVMREAVQEAGRALADNMQDEAPGNWYPFDGHEEAWERPALLIAAALLGNVRVAEAVGRVFYADYGDEGELRAGIDVDGAGNELWLNSGDDVAILERKR